jgi:hypothetical protein
MEEKEIIFKNKVIGKMRLNGIIAEYIQLLTYLDTGKDNFFKTVKVKWEEDIDKGLPSYNRNQIKKMKFKNTENKEWDINNCTCNLNGLTCDYCKGFDRVNIGFYKKDHKTRI